ncbi:gem-associated protein 2 isoform X1 [Polistes fuscatus]|uniref:gem-associated protein 2 isoform X1 n=2 Tax=Polistes fuscatus TaxID=30207 RepID=UPI001CA9F2C0|nr:gem-associated protein 2 isoform X1 [Polistes fuscatus]
MLIFQNKENEMDYMKEPAFYVEDIEDIDLKQPPKSGEDYIKRVILEAKQYADTVVADINPELCKKPTMDIHHLPGCVKAPSSLIPIIKWQERQVENFKDLKLYVIQMQDRIKSSKREWKPQETQLPDIDDKEGWINYCSNESRDDKENHSPTLTTIISMKQPLIEQVLEYLIEYVQTQGKLPFKIGQWLYALLVVLHLPLNPDTCSWLRSLARICSIIRANSKKLEEHEIAALNLFICLVARYYRQMDLAD